MGVLLGAGMDPDRLLTLSLDQLLVCAQAIQLDRALTVSGLLGALAGGLSEAVPGALAGHGPRRKAKAGDLDAFLALNGIPVEVVPSR